MLEANIRCHKGEEWRRHPCFWWCAPRGRRQSSVNSAVSACAIAVSAARDVASLFASAKNNVPALLLNALPPFWCGGFVCAQVQAKPRKFFK